MNQISLNAYVPQMGMQQIFFVIDKNELFQLFKEWLASPNTSGDAPVLCPPLVQKEQSPIISNVPAPLSPSTSPQQVPYTPPSPPAQSSNPAFTLPMMMPEGYYSREEVAQMLQVDKSTLWRWDKTGMLKCVKLGPRKVGYSKEAVKLFIEKRNDDGK